MRPFKKVKSCKVIPEKCVTEAEFNNAVEELLIMYRKVMSNVENTADMSAIKMAVISRISAFEQLEFILFERRKRNAEH